MSNAKKITILWCVVLCLSIISYAIANRLVGEDTKDVTPTVREQCSAGSVDAWKSYIQEQQSWYELKAKELETYSGNANKAREIIKQQLSWTFI